VFHRGSEISAACRRQFLGTGRTVGEVRWAAVFINWISDKTRRLGGLISRELARLNRVSRRRPATCQLDVCRVGNYSCDARWYFGNQCGDVFTIMRYINPRFNYLLTYLLTYILTYLQQQEIGVLLHGCRDISRLLYQGWAWNSQDRSKSNQMKSNQIKFIFH